MIFCFDFDHTLFDTAKLRQDLNRIFLNGGVGQASFDASYNELARGVGYEPHVQAGLLAAEWRDTAARDSAMRDVSELMKSGRGYVFEGATELLAALKGRGHRLVILTLGNRSWQRQKIVSSGLAGLFDQTEIVPGPGRKALRLVEIVDKHDSVTIIDDNPGELAAIMAMRPGSRCVYYHRPVNPYPNPGCEEAVNMVELKQLLLNV